MQTPVLYLGLLVSITDKINTSTNMLKYIRHFQIICGPRSYIWKNKTCQVKMSDVRGKFMCVAVVTWAITLQTDWSHSDLRFKRHLTPFHYYDGATKCSVKNIYHFAFFFFFLRVSFFRTSGHLGIQQSFKFPALATDQFSFAATICLSLTDTSSVYTANIFLLNGLSNVSTTSSLFWLR